MHNWMLCHNPQKSENDKKWHLVFYVAQQLFVFLSVYDEIEKRLD